MRVCTFGELFKRYLEELISLGGDVSNVVTLVNVYQRRDLIARQIAFGEWLENELFLCERCGAEFSGRRIQVDEDDYVLCLGCSSGRCR